MRKILDDFETRDRQEENWRLFVGPRADYYLREWRKIKDGQRFTFNLWAFVFGVFWLLYRQMLRPTVLYLSLYFAAGFVEKIVFQSLGMPIPPIWWFAVRTLLFSLLLGLLGNWVYLIDAEGKIQQINSNYPPERRREMLRLKGGTSAVPVVLFVLLILIILLTNFLLSPLAW